MSDVTAAEVEAASFRKAGKLYARVTTVVIAAIVGIMMVYAIVVLRGIAATTLLRLALSWSPCIFYLWALWTLRRLFTAVALSGPGARLDVTQPLSDIGSALMFGALTSLIVTPMVTAMTQPHRLGGFALFDVPALTLGLVGLGLLIIARILQRALRFEAQATSLKGVLEGFV